MLLSASWFGQRARGLDEQLRIAADRRFEGVALLPGAAPPTEPWPDPERFPPGMRVGAAAWDALIDPARDERGPSWAGPPRARAAIAALTRLRCPLLIVPAGSESEPGAHERGERLLGRLRAGDAMEGDEALEELGRGSEAAAERQLQELAMTLHTLQRALPGLGLALAPGPSPAGLLTPDRLALLLADLPNPAIGLWHDPADAETRAAFGLPPAGAWLDRFRGRILGVTLCDSAGGGDRLPPGVGTVDWPLLAEYLPRTAVRVLDLAPSYPEEWLAEARTLLADRRIH
jgi:sugar phosphate isomerase/epimerase